MESKRDAFAPFASLADRFAILVRRLDAVVEEAIRIHEESSQGAPEISADGDFRSIVGLLDESVFQLHVWASDISYQNFSTRSGSLVMRDVDAYAVLSIIDACRMPVAEHLRLAFEALETDILTISLEFSSRSQGSKEDWYS